MTAPGLAPLAPRYVADRIAPLQRSLVALLRTLTPDDWHRPTIAGAWTVQDVAAHLLDGDLRKLSSYRDSHLPLPSESIQTDRDLVRFINAQNAVGVASFARVSPRVITDLLDVASAWIADLFTSLPPHAPSRFAVSWAGEARSENWMDTGREYTERWHHQAQIRAAVGAPLQLEPEWFDPLLDFSVRALPVAYRDVVAPEGTCLTIIVSGLSDWSWSVVREHDGWKVFRGQPGAPDTVVRIADDAAWRLFYNALDAESARAIMSVEGGQGLADALLSARSVIV